MGSSLSTHDSSRHRRSTGLFGSSSLTALERDISEHDNSSQSTLPRDDVLHAHTSLPNRTGKSPINRRISSMKESLRKSVIKPQSPFKAATYPRSRISPRQDSSGRLRRSLRLSGLFESGRAESQSPVETSSARRHDSVTTSHPPVLPNLQLTTASCPDFDRTDLTDESDLHLANTSAVHEAANNMPGHESCPDLAAPLLETTSDETHFTADMDVTETQETDSGEVVSPMPGEDQAAMLSRLLSVAAAATAASLVGQDNSQALRDAREVSSSGTTNNENATNADAPTNVSSESSDLVDGSFDGFLAALQSGRLAQALRNGGNVLGGGSQEIGPHQPLNFFRMFRFSSSVTISGTPEPLASDGRMVPIIIVGIRSVSNREDGQFDREVIPPFFDSLEGLNSRRDTEQSPADDSTISLTPLETQQDSIPASHVRVAAQHNSGDVGDASTVTNATAASRQDVTSSRSTSQTRPDQDAQAATSRPSGLVDTVMDRLRHLRNHDSTVSDQTQDRRRWRRRSGWMPLSNTEGENNDSDRSQSRSWIIYVLGGTYPENHPILTTPSLFTDSPTYEDMMLLSNLIGPAKPETAAPDDLDTAGEISTIDEMSSKLDERCLICITDYQTGDVCRELKKCSHSFHQTCIDEWLTTGRNTCPCCREHTGARTLGTVAAPTTSDDPSQAN